MKDHQNIVNGEESLNLELARRHTLTQAELALNQNPPSPTFCFLLPKNGKAMTELLE